MGLAIAGQLIRRGINVCLADVKPPPEGLVSGPGKSVYVRANLNNHDEVKKTVKRALKELGAIHYLVNTVGVLWLERDKSAVDVDMAVWDEVMGINLRPMVFLVKQVIPEMRKSGFGAMVHFSSIDALSGDPLPQDAYGASKAALIRLSKSLAIQFAKDRIRCNAVLPGPALTPMQARWRERPDLQTQVERRIPLGRLGSADDMANACLFLLSDNAGFITGTELIVDGGITAQP